MTSSEDVTLLVYPHFDISVNPQAAMMRDLESRLAQLETNLANRDAELQLVNNNLESSNVKVSEMLVELAAKDTIIVDQGHRILQNEQQFKVQVRQVIQYISSRISPGQELA